jgi:chitinase
MNRIEQSRKRPAYAKPCAGFVSAVLMSLAFSNAAHAAPVTESEPRLIGYLPGYTGVSYTDYARTIDFSEMTHLNLAFGNPPKCDGVCTAQSSMEFSIKGQSDADVLAIVHAAHASGVKVLLSIGGGGGDQLILPFYNAGLSEQLVASLDKYLRSHDIDGVDVDIEDPSNMGAPYARLVDVLCATLHPEHKLVTAAVAKYLQDAMPDSALQQFDFINVMTYSSYSLAVTALDYYSIDKKVLTDKIVLGVPLFGANTGDTKEEDYQTLLAAYPNAWKVDMVGGGNLDDGQSFNYVGESTMAKETLLARKYGGIMVWEMMGDAPAPHSLLNIIRKNLSSAESAGSASRSTKNTSAIN